MSPFRVTFAVALVVSITMPAHSKKTKEEAPLPCPIDGTLRTADPKLLDRFAALAGCTEQLLVAPATPSDFVDPDGTVIIRSDRDNRPSRSDEASYELVYASTLPTVIEPDEDQDTDRRKPVKKNKDRGTKNAKVSGAKTEYYSYGATSTAPSLSDTGIAIRIVPEPQPVNAALPQFSGAEFANPAGATDMAILSMRPRSFRTRYDEMISNIATSHRVDPLFLHAVIYQESRYRPAAISHAGAKGLMQIMPATGRGLGVHPSHLTDPLTNIDAGARLLRKLHGRYSGNFELILAAYNAGEGAVAKYGNSIPPYRETQDYVKKVMAKYSELLAEQNGVAPSQ